jgi:hypothetical protein
MNFDLNENNFEIWLKLKELLFRTEEESGRCCWNEKPIFLCLEDYWFILNHLTELFRFLILIFMKLLNKIQINQKKLKN